MPNESVGERFKEAREKHNWTQKELADKVGYSFNYISDVERGKSFPRLDRLINILNTLDVSPNFILCDVLNEVPKEYLSDLEGRLQELSVEKQRKVLALLDFAIKQELAEEDERSSPKEDVGKEAPGD